MAKTVIDPKWYKQTKEEATRKARKAGKKQGVPMYVYQTIHGGYSYSRYVMSGIVHTIENGKIHDGLKHGCYPAEELEENPRERKVLNIEGHCPDCVFGSVHKFPTKHCPKCGKQLKFYVTFEAPRTHCFKCHERLPAKGKHCPSCGESRGRLEKKMAYDKVGEYAEKITSIPEVPVEGRPRHIQVALMGWLLFVFSCTIIACDKFDVIDIEALAKQAWAILGL